MFTWTPTEAQGPASYTFDVVRQRRRASSDSETITVTVSEVNVAPVLGPIGDQTVAEETLLTLHGDGNAMPTSRADADASAWRVRRRAPASPAGGVFTWTPTEAQGPGTYTFDVCVSDGALTDCETITVTVSEVNRAPVLGAIGQQDRRRDDRAAPSRRRRPTTDLPANTLTFSLVGAPAGASITTGGAFTWTPTEAQGPGSYPFTVKVCDNGTPSLCDDEAITVTVSEVNARSGAGQHRQ